MKQYENKKQQKIGAKRGRNARNTSKKRNPINQL